MILEELPYWLALWRVKGIGSAHFRHITERFGCMLTFFSQSSEQLRALGLNAAQIAQIQGFQSGSEPQISAAVDKDLDWQDASDQHHILTWASDDYPPLLREIAGAPPVLFVRGDPDCLVMPQIAIVGSRHCSRKGRSLAEDFSRCFSRHGFITTSGLALGIGTAAHSGALASGGQTIAVLAHGLDSVYPARNRKLADEIASQGALVSEFPIGVQARPEFFPRRNRIISGLSLGVLVVEAALKSGSLITAHEAVDQGREVFAIPGSIHDPLVKGCHSLIRNGAKLVETADQVVEELMPLLGFVHQQYQLPLHESPLQQDEIGHKFDKSSPEARLLEALQFDSANVDQLVGLTGMSVADVNSTLIMLELEGMVAQEQGGYSRV